MSRSLRLVSTGLALGTTFALSFGSAAAFAAPPAPATPAVSAPSVSAPSAAPVPAFPGVNASDAQLEAWAQAVATTLHVPAPPAENATDEQWMAYLQRVMTSLGAPSADASQADWTAWMGKMASSLGFPSPPPASAGDEAWIEWLQNTLGLDIADLLDSAGADAMLSEPYCSSSGGQVDVSAINLGSSAATLKPFLDGHALKAIISMAGTSATAIEPAMFDGTIAVPNGKHVISIVNSATGETLDTVNSSLHCGSHAGSGTSTGSSNASAKPAASAPTAPSHAPGTGPKVETDLLTQPSSDADLTTLGGGLMAIVALVVARAGRKRLVRR